MDSVDHSGGQRLLGKFSWAGLGGQQSGFFVPLPV
jgi:hypothetical protein